MSRNQTNQSSAELTPTTAGSLLALLVDSTMPEAEEDSAKGSALARRLRRLILEGALQPGSRLPASRALAQHLGYARGTIETAYGDLEAEGLLERRRGDGSFVAHVLDRLERPVERRNAETGFVQVRFSGRGQRLAGLDRCPYPERDRSFASGVPDARLFPWTEWRRLTASCLSGSARDLSGYTPPQGLPALRGSLARWLRLTRGIQCTAEQILVLHSGQQALSLAATLLFDAGARIALEDPGYVGAQVGFASAGLKTVAVPVDKDGIVTEVLARRRNLAGVYVTPSYQNPLGTTLSLARRLDLIEWAEREQAWIIEDDYAGGLTYDRNPIAALAGLDTTGRTIYIGSCSKLVFPGLRLAWMVLPEGMVEGFTTLRANQDGHCAALPQAVLASFMDDGHLTRHVKRMGVIYRRRRDVLVGQIEALNRMAGQAVFRPLVANAGLKLAVELAPPLEDRPFADLARDEGLDLPVLSETALDLKNRRQGFILGFSGLTELEIEERAARLRKATATALRQAGMSVGSL